MLAVVSGEEETRCQWMVVNEYQRGSARLSAVRATVAVKHSWNLNGW